MNQIKSTCRIPPLSAEIRYWFSREIRELHMELYKSYRTLMGREMKINEIQMQFGAD
jgi:hypothetical protein